MKIQNTIEQKLTDNLKPAFMEVINESGKHNVPEGSESHFKVIIASADFHSLSAVKRHQLMYKLLAEELQGPVHALALHTYTPEEWAVQNEPPPDSPPCLGGGH